MLKIFFFILFLMPICFLKKIFWLVQNLIILGGGLIFLENFNSSIFSLGLFFGFDLMSFGLILLSFWVCSLIIIARRLVYKQNLNFIYFLLNIFFLLFFLFLTFRCINIFLFYLFFERSLIPTLFLILG
jgi:NADH-ubiquinone oxidoreductase chain 4